MNVENVVTSILIAVSSICLAFMLVVFNTGIPPLFKDFKKKTEKAFVVAAFVICDILILCALILVVCGIIGKI